MRENKYAMHEYRYTIKALNDFVKDLEKLTGRKIFIRYGFEKAKFKRFTGVAEHNLLAEIKEHVRVFKNPLIASIELVNTQLEYFNFDFKVHNKECWDVIKELIKKRYRRRFRGKNCTFNLSLTA